MAFLPQGSFSVQGSKHWFSMQALLSGHSVSCSHSPFLILLHWRYGSPSKPAGQEQLDLWFCTVHIADGLHGLSMMQGLMQALFLHAWLEEHSESDEHPTGSGSIIISQRTSPFPVKPGRHVQLMVRRGKVLCTSHLAFWAQGWMALHGFWHSRSMHACLLGHSRSSLLPGSGGGGMGVHAIPYGSPVNPGRHMHIPLWFLGVQSAFLAQSQGSTHFSFLHVSVVEQSGSVRHSGRRHRW